MAGTALPTIQKLLTAFLQGKKLFIIFIKNDAKYCTVEAELNALRTTTGMSLLFVQKTKQK